MLTRFQSFYKFFFSALGALQAHPLFSMHVEWQVEADLFEIYFAASTRQVEQIPGAIMELSTGCVFMVNWLQQEFFDGNWQPFDFDILHILRIKNPQLRLGLFIARGKAEDFLLLKKSPPFS